MAIRSLLFFFLAASPSLANAWTFEQLIESHVVVGSEVRLYLYEDGEVRELAAALTEELCQEKAQAFSPEAEGVLMNRYQRLSSNDRAFYNLGTNPGLVARTVAFCFAVIEQD